MISKTILGISLAAVFAVSMIMLPIAIAQLSFLDIVEAEIEVDDGEFEMEVEMAADFLSGAPDTPYGIVALTSDFQDMPGTTTHGGVGPDSETQQGGTGAVEHNHIVDATMDADCASGVKVTSASFDDPGDLEVDDEEIEVENIPMSRVGDLTGVVLSFTLSFDDENDDGIDSLCVNPQEAFNADFEVEDDDD